MDPSDHDIVLGALGIAVTILFGIAGFARKSFSDAKADIAERISELALRTDAKYVESRADREALWAALRQHQSDAERMNREILSKIGLMASRDDLYRATQDLKTDIAKMFTLALAADKRMRDGGISLT